jgi:hypothetical protein
LCNSAIVLPFLSFFLLSFLMFFSFPVVFLVMVLRPPPSQLPIPLHPLLEDTTLDSAQAMKDMHRERLTVNGPEVAPADVPRLLAEAIHRLLEEKLARSDAAARANGEDPLAESAAAEAVASVEAEAATRRRSEASGRAEAVALALAANGPVKPHKEEPSETLVITTLAQRQSRVHASLTDHLVLRTINAASRTTSGGDAFFIVQDLYGGDGVLVKPSGLTAPPIEIVVDVNGVTVRSQDSYEIYHEEEVAEAEDAFPLMIMHTAMSENIPLPDPHIIRKYMCRREYVPSRCVVSVYITPR